MVIDIQNFNSIKTLHYEIVDSKINFLFGISGSGKSSIAYALTDTNKEKYQMVGKDAGMVKVEVNESDIKYTDNYIYNSKFMENILINKQDGQDQNLSERDKSFLNGEFLSGYVYVSKDCEEEKTNVVNGFVSFLYEIKGNIKEDMDFLNDIDKESLADAPDTRISTSMSYKLEYKKNYIMFSAIPSLIEKLIYLALFIISIFISWSLLYSAIKDLDHNLGILKSLGCSKCGLLTIALLLSFGISILEFLLVLFGIGIIDSCLDGLYFYVPLLLIKIDYILLLLLFVIVVGLIPSISAIVKSITKKPIKVINSED